MDITITVEGSVYSRTTYHELNGADKEKLRRRIWDTLVQLVDAGEFDVDDIGVHEDIQLQVEFSS